MIKRTLYFSNPAYISKKDDQLVIKQPNLKEEKQQTEDESKPNKYESRLNLNTIPIEDIGLLILDNPQITITHGLISALLENNCAIVTCNYSHLPSGLMLNLSGNQTQTEKFKAQIEASEPLRKNLWQQTITAKIKNQALHLKKRKKDNRKILELAKKVRSGDPDNYEGRAAAYYWKNLFPEELNFFRDPDGEPPNNLLNYGYAILRAIVARGLVSSGLLPTLGIHHHNRYNAYCLADDIMEPFRPFVDDVVYDIVESGEDITTLNSETKKKLLSIATYEMLIEDEGSPLMVGLQRTTASLARCFIGEVRKIIFPEFVLVKTE